MRNPSSYAVATLARCNAPFGERVLHAGDYLLARAADTGTGQDEYVEWTPFGPMHEGRHGSPPRLADSAVPVLPGEEVATLADAYGYRYATLALPVQLAAGEVRTIPIYREATSQRARALGPNLFAQVLGRQMSMALTIEGATVELIGTGGPEPVIRHNGDNRFTATYGTRCPLTWDAPHYAVLTIEVAAVGGYEHLRFWLEWGASNPLIDTVIHQIYQHDATLRVRGARCVIRHAADKVLDSTSEGELDTTYTIARRYQQLYDGSGQLLIGALVFDRFPTVYGDGAIERTTGLGLTSVREDVYAQAIDWPTHGTYGAFGVVPTRPPWLSTQQEVDDAAVAKATRDYDSHIRGDPWCYQQYGMMPNAGQTGDQPDFGVVRHWFLARSGHPAPVHVLQRAAAQEYCRWSALLESDLSAKVFSDGTWLLRQDHEFYNSENARSPDMRGKTGENIRSANGGIVPPWPMDPITRTYWTGRDPQHYSNNCPTFYQLMQGDPGMERWVDRAVEQWLATRQRGRTANTSFNISNLGARATARLWAAGLQLYLLRADPRLLEVILYHLEHDPGPGDPGGIIHNLVVGDTAFTDFNTEGRGDRIFVTHCLPWQESFVVYAAWAIYRETGNANARRLAKDLTRGMMFSRQWHDRRTVEQYLYTSSTWTGAPIAGEEISGSGSGASGKLKITRRDGSRQAVYLYDCVGLFLNDDTLTGNTSGATLSNITAERGFNLQNAMYVSATGEVATPAQLLEFEPRAAMGMKYECYSDGTAFSTWGIASVLIGLWFAYEDGDNAMRNKALDILGANDDPNDPHNRILLRRWQNVNDPWDEDVERWVGAMQNPPWVGE